MDTATVEAGLRKFLHKNTGHDPAFAGLARLSGGAGRETWTFDAQLGDEKLEGIFRCDPVAGIESKTSLTGASVDVSARGMDGAR